MCVKRGDSTRDNSVHFIGLRKEANNEIRIPSGVRRLLNLVFPSLELGDKVRDTDPRYEKFERRGGRSMHLNLRFNTMSAARRLGADVGNVARGTMV